MIAAAVRDALGVAVADTTRVGGGSICPAWRARLADGRLVFVKTHPQPPDGFFGVEATGLRWLGTAVPGLVPEVLAVRDDLIVLEWVEPGAWSAPTAERLGRDLAELHRAGAERFGGAPGFIGTLPLDNTPAPDWATFYAERRVLPFAALALARAAIDTEGMRSIEAVCDRLDTLVEPGEPPARVHGDLWSGNVLAARDGRARLVDPAPFGGHREIDLAMLELFGSPHPRIVAAYEEAYPPAEGWQERIALHQLYPLLVHACLFGGSYGAAAVRVARRYAARSPR